jgi:glycosyltransferase involved in cell wall biosynthesis
MTNPVAISVIIPCYNAEAFIKKCLESLFNQSFKENFEIIVVDDASNDKTAEIVKSYNKSNIKFFFLKENSGPATARNLGLQNATGEYVFFLDVDDTISHNIFSSLYYTAKEKKFDMVFCDKKLIENSENQRNNKFYYLSDKIFNKSEIINELFERFTNPFSYSGIFLHYGKLIKRSLLIKNNIFFEEKLRYLEDEVFGWDTLAFSNNIAYIRKQLYSYYINPKANTARSDAFNKGYPISNFFIIKDHVKKSLLIKGVNKESAEKFSNHAFAYFIINSLISYSMSIMLKKIDKKIGETKIKIFIKEIVSNPEIIKAFRQYSPSKNESKWIPKAIITKWIFIIQLACNQRCRTILRKSRNN